MGAKIVSDSKVVKGTHKSVDELVDDIRHQVKKLFMDGNSNLNDYPVLANLLTINSNIQHNFRSLELNDYHKTFFYIYAQFFMSAFVDNHSFKELKIIAGLVNSLRQKIHFMSSSEIPSIENMPAICKWIHSVHELPNSKAEIQKVKTLLSTRKSNLGSLSKKTETKKKNITEAPEIHQDLYITEEELKKLSTEIQKEKTRIFRKQATDDLTLKRLEKQYEYVFNKLRALNAA